MAMSHAGGRSGAVFLDKDGTLLENVPYNVDPDRMRLAPGADRALRELGRLGLPLVVVTNQPGVALGRFRVDALEAVRVRLAEMFAEHGAALAGLFYCPHHPDGVVPRYAVDCLCRKPRPGMLLCAASLLSVDLRQSWMIGDLLDDVEAGQRAGCKTILVVNGGETEWRMSPEREPRFLVHALDEAAEIVARTLQHARRAGAPADTEPSWT